MPKEPTRDRLVSIIVPFLNEADSLPALVDQIESTIGKTLPSKIFNHLVRMTFKLDLHDINCGYKAYTRNAAHALNLYGELHRFTPALLHGIGFSVKEIAVQHNPRRFGTSKYGAARFVKGLLDLLTVVLLTRYHARPLHFFGAAAMIMGGLGFLVLAYLTMLWFADLGPIGNRPLFFLGILLVVSATQLLSVGLIAELFQTSRLRESGKYMIRDVAGFQNDPDAFGAVFDDTLSAARVQKSTAPLT